MKLPVYLEGVDRDEYDNDTCHFDCGRVKPNVFLAGNIFLEIISSHLIHRYLPDQLAQGPVNLKVEEYE